MTDCGIPYYTVDAFTDTPFAGKARRGAASRQSPVTSIDSSISMIGMPSRTG